MWCASGLCERVGEWMSEVSSQRACQQKQPMHRSLRLAVKPYIVLSAHCVSYKETQVFYLFFPMARQPLGGLGLLIFRGFAITHFRNATLGKTPLYEWPARRRDLNLTTHNTQKRQTYMPSAGFEPKIPASEPYTFRFYKEVQKEIITLASQGLATANNIVRCFSLHLAKSAVWITVKQAHNIQVLLHRSMAREDCSYRSQLMPA